MPAHLAFLSGSPGPGELLLLFLVVLIFFGPKRLPSIARSIAHALNELRRASQDFRDQIMRLDEDDEGHRAARDFVARDPVRDVEPESLRRELPLRAGDASGDIPEAPAGETAGSEESGERGAGDDLAG